MNSISRVAMGISIYSPPAMPYAETERRAAVQSSGLLDPVYRAALRQLVRSAAMLMQARMAAATLLLDDRQLILAGYHVAETMSQRSTSICGHTILTAPAILFIPDTKQDERFAENPVVTDRPYIRFYIGAPLMAAGGHALGALCVFDDRPRASVPRHAVDGLRALADQLVAIPRLRTRP